MLLKQASARVDTVDRIVHIKAGSRPEYRFEWHPRSRRVYLIRVGAVPQIGEVLAFDISTHGDAVNAVLIWLRGFAEGALPRQPKLHLAV